MLDKMCFYMCSSVFLIYSDAHREQSLAVVLEKPRDVQIIGSLLPATRLQPQQLLIIAAWLLSELLGDYQQRAAPTARNYRQILYM
jgi:hypothetical protein